MDYERKIDTLELDSEEASDHEEGYSPRRHNKQSSLLGRLLGKSKFSLLIGLGILGLFVLVAGLSQRSNSFDSEIKTRSLERRIKQLEEKLYSLDWIETRLDQIEEKNGEFTTFMKTFDRVTALSRSSPSQVSKVEKKALYHLVSSGETLYGISRRYGLTVKDLRRLNKLSPEANIYPDQKLLIRQGQGA
jgi:LysM repeat protein